MIAATTVVGIDVSRDWLDGLDFPGQKRFRLANSADGHEQLILAIREMPGPVKVGFEATGGQEWVLWAKLVAAGIDARQLPPAQIKAFALSRGTRAKTDRIDAELIARFMLFRPDAGRSLPSENLRVLRTLTTRRAQTVDMRKRLAAQIAARKKQDILADIEGMDDALTTILDSQIGELERRIESVIAQEESSASKARLLRSIPGIGPVSAAMLIAEMPELGRMTSGEAAAMTGLAPVPHDSGTMRGKRAIAGGRRAL
ncbi:IS110 family transposase [Aquamicrobium terrae]|uniref:Transposase n=1 Tax=Aquamicrobium terrae TaxID=1324945 RepID=A0ABV2N7E8_9HYPH